MQRVIQLRQSFYHMTASYTTLLGNFHIQSSNPGFTRLDLEKLRSQACMSAFVVDIENRFDALQSLDLATGMDAFRVETWKLLD